MYARFKIEAFLIYTTANTQRKIMWYIARWNRNLEITFCSKWFSSLSLLSTLHLVPCCKPTGAWMWNTSLILKEVLWNDVMKPFGKWSWLCSQLALCYFRLKFINENCDFGQTFLVIFTVISSPLNNSCLLYDLLLVKLSPRGWEIPV